MTEQREVDRMKSEFISVVSHELRTPLTAIKGALGLVASGTTGVVSDDAQKLIHIAATNTDRLTRLVSDMLDLERIESGQIPLVLVDIDLGEILHEAITIMTPIAQREGVELVTDDTAVRVTVDKDRILQTLTNLLSNAVKFSPAGSSVFVDVDEQRTFEETRATIRVIDHGRGVPQDKLDDIFVRFHQVDASDSRTKGGTGLGLAICKNIVEEHAGDIWMEGTPDGGATCVFTLPLSRP